MGMIKLIITLWRAINALAALRRALGTLLQSTIVIVRTRKYFEKNIILQSIFRRKIQRHYLEIIILVFIR